MDVRSNWVVDSLVELHEAVQEAPTLPSEDVAELLDEDKCFSLTKPDEGASDEACSIRLSCAHPAPWRPLAGGSAGGNKAIKAVLLHSEAKVVEICVGAHDEYLKTVHGKRLGQYEDTEMCSCLVEFSVPRREVLLTLKHTYSPECVWVFGLLVVTVQDHKPGSSDGRFSGTHLSSVLKDKEVNMSKDAARFLHLLESCNASDYASGQINENNQLTLMSMFLGPKVLGKAQLSSGNMNMDGGKGDKGEVNNEEGNTSGCSANEVDGDAGKGGSAVSESRLNDEERKVDKAHSVPSKFQGLGNTDDNIENRMKKLELIDKENNQTNLNDEPASERTKHNIKTGSNLYKEPVVSKTQSMLSAVDQDGMIEKLFALMENTGQRSLGQQNTPGQHSITKPVVTSPPLGSSLHRHPRSPQQSAAAQDSSSLQLTMMHTLMESLGKIPTPAHNLQSPHTTVSDPTHFTPMSREVKNNNGLLKDSSGGVLGLEWREVFLQEVENMIDQKFAQMEERLTKRIEQKLAEKAQNDNERLEKIEGHICNLWQRLLR